MESNIPDYLCNKGYRQPDLPLTVRQRHSFLNRTIVHAAGAVKSIYLQAENASHGSFIHRIHPNVKLVSLIYLEIVISIVRHPAAQMAATFAIFFLFLLARLKLIQVYRKIFFLAFIFGFLIMIPASLNLVSPGKIIFNLVAFQAPSRFLIYQIPQNIGFTAEGFQVVSLVFLRVLNSVAFALLIVYTTSLPAFIKSLKTIGVPDTFLMVISLACKYIFILSRSIEETFLALKSRMIGNLHNSTIRKIVSGLIFNIFKKSMKRYEDTWHAMLSRGYRGKVILHTQQPLSPMDFVALATIVAIGIGLMLI